MNVNTDVYGVESVWFKMVQESTNPDSIRTSAIPLLANFGTNSRLSNGYQNGRLTINQPIDNSIATVGVDNNCILLNQSYINIPTFDLNNPQEYTEFDILCNMNKNGTNAVSFFINIQPVRDSGFPLYNTTYNKILSGYQQILDISNTNTTYYTTQPLTSVPLKDMPFCIIVKVSNSDPYNERITTVSYYDLYTYCYGDTTVNNVTKKVYEHYPVIVNISVVPFFRNNREIIETNPLNTVYRRTDNNSTSLYPCVMNGYETVTNPFTDDDSPFQVLNYNQPLFTNPESSCLYLRIYSDVENNTLTSYNLNTGVAMFCGTRTGNGTYNSGYKYNYIGTDHLKCRFWLDNRVIRGNIWTDIETFGGVDDFYEYWIEQVAYLGTFYTDSIDIAIHATEWNIPHTFIGTIDDNGVTHGYYTEGEENESQKQYDWTDFKDNNFNPNNSRPNGEDKEVASDSYNFNRTYFGFQTGNYYALTENDLNSLKQWIDTATNPSGDFVISNPDSNEYTYEQLSQEMRKLFNGQYPEDMLLNLLYFPFDIPSNLSGIEIGQSNIKLGAITTQSKSWFDSTLPDVTAWKLNRGKQYAEFITQPYDIREYFGDFRDYPPYTSMQLVIPYHSTVPIDAGMLYGHSIYVHVFCDIITGSSTAFVMRDNGIPIASVDGQMGVPQMLISRNVGQYITGLTTNAQDINQLKFQAIQVGTNTISSGVTAIMSTSAGAGLSGALGTLDTVNQIPKALELAKKYENKSIDLKHMQAGSTIISQNSPSVSMVTDVNVRLVIHRPKLMPTYNATSYGNTIGFACMDFGTVGSFSGYSVFSGVSLQGISAPENEKNMIYSLLQSGVYI